MSTNVAVRGRFRAVALLTVALTFGWTLPVVAQSDLDDLTPPVLQADPKPKRVVKAQAPQVRGKRKVHPKPVRPAVGKSLKSIAALSAGDATRESIFRALKSKAALDVKEAPLKEVFQFISETHEIPIVIDARALDDVGFDTDWPVTMQLRDVSLRALLRLMLNELDLTYVVRDEVLKITTPEEAENELSVRLYPVSNLAHRQKPLLFADRAPGPYRLVVDLIHTMVEPDTWDEVGGAGSVAVYESGGFLAIAQTDEIHEEIDALLTFVRRARAMPPTAKDRFLPISNVQQTETTARARIDAALGKDVTLEFADAPLSDIVDFIAKTKDIPVVIDRRALEDVGLAPETPVSCSLRGISLRSALRLMLKELDLTYNIRNEVLKITTPEVSENELATYVYVVSDLLPAKPRSGEHNARGKRLDSLIDLLMGTIVPDSWDDVGGAGAVEPTEPWGLLVISQTDAVHAQVRALLSAARKIHSKPAPSRAPMASTGAGSMGLTMAALRPRSADAAASKPRSGGYVSPQPKGGGLAPKPSGMGPMGGIAGFWAGPGARPGGPLTLKIYEVPKELMIKELIPVIKGTVEPLGWLQGGAGPCIHAVGNKLLIRQTQRGHAAIVELLDALDPNARGGMGGGMF